MTDTAFQPLEIVYMDDHMVAINKPHGLVVHRSGETRDATRHALQLLRNQIRRYVYPVHRLDRKTSGVLLFALDEQTNVALHALFKERQIEKVYHAIVRGYTDDEGLIDRPLKNKTTGVYQDAVTRFRTLARRELPIPSGGFPTSRYSLVELYPLTGRRHQLRRHLARAGHPIIGDRPHGCNKQNRIWKEHFGITEMLLHASSLRFKHPITGQEILICAREHEPFSRARQILDLPPQALPRPAHDA